jgi:hypothetical protein
MGYMAGGSVVAGLYGVVHDQITFTLSPEYFTKLKFDQFSYLDFGWPDRVLVAEIGFVATWWVGLLAGWVLGRIGVVGDAPPIPKKTVWMAFLILIGFVFAAGILGYGYGTLTFETSPQLWKEWNWFYGVEDLAAFARVGYIHLFGYLGALAGLIMSALWLSRLRRGGLSN